MPAITVEDITVLPRIPAPDPATVANARSGASRARRRATRARGSRFAAPSRGVDLGALDPFIHLDQMGEVEYAPGEPKGTPVASASRLRDRHVHDGRHVRARRLQRRRRRDHQRRHAVDDRRRGHPAHREAARGARRHRRPVPRHPALGEPARRPEVGTAALPGHPRSRGRPAGFGRRRSARAGDRRRIGRVMPGPASPTRR